MFLNLVGFVFLLLMYQTWSWRSQQPRNTIGPDKLTPPIPLVLKKQPSTKACSIQPKEEERNRLARQTTFRQLLLDSSQTPWKKKTVASLPPAERGWMGSIDFHTCQVLTRCPIHPQGVVSERDLGLSSQWANKFPALTTVSSGTLPPPGSNKHPLSNKSDSEEEWVIRTSTTTQLPWGHPYLSVRGAEQGTLTFPSQRDARRGLVGNLSPTPAQQYFVATLPRCLWVWSGESRLSSPPSSNHMASPLPLLQLCQRKPAKTKRSHNIIPQMSRFYLKITHHTKN